MSTKPGIWFIQRRVEDSTRARGARRLDAPTILSFFQTSIDEARIASDPSQVAQAALGDAFSRFFQRVQSEVLHTPRTMAALRKMLCEHLWGDGDAQQARAWILADAHSLRILRPGAPVLLFIEDEALVEQPERFAFLVREDDALPDGYSAEAFAAPFDLPTTVLGDAGVGASYVGWLVGTEGRPGKALRFEGIDLPGLLDRLTSEHDACPEELTALREALKEQASTAPSSAHAWVMEAGRSGWIMFDDRWAAANTDLATSMLQYVLAWDPGERLKPPAPPRATRAAAPRRTREKQVRVSKPRATKAEKRAASEQHANWVQALAGRTGDDAQPYSPRLFFEEGAVLEHAKFGLGVVSRSEASKCEVVFEHGVRLLVHGVGSEPSKDPICL